MHSGKEHFNNSDQKGIIKDLFDFDHRQKEIHNELKIKTEKIEQLQKKLDTANMQVLHLNNSLEEMKCNLKQEEYRCNLTIKNANFLEEKLKEKNETSEKEALQKLAEKQEIENNELSRKIESLMTQHEYDKIFQNELVNQDNKIRSSIAEIESCLNKLEIEQKDLSKVSSVENTVDKLNKKVHFYEEEIKGLKNINQEQEKKLLFSEEHYSKLKELCSDLMAESDSGLPLHEWEECLETYKNQLKYQNQKIEILEEQLRHEREFNKTFLIDMKTKLNFFETDKLQFCSTEVQTEDVKIVKEEIINILD